MTAFKHIFYLTGFISLFCSSLFAKGLDQSCIHGRNYQVILEDVKRHTEYSNTFDSLTKQLKYLENTYIKRDSNDQTFEYSLLMMKCNIYQRISKFDIYYENELNKVIVSLLKSEEFFKCPEHQTQIQLLINLLRGENRFLIVLDLLKYYSKHEDKFQGYHLYDVIASFFYSIEAYDWAILYYEKAISKMSEEFKLEKASRLNNIGLCYEKLNKKDDAKINFNKAIDFLEARKDLSPSKYEYNAFFKTVIHNNIIRLDVDYANYRITYEYYMLLKEQHVLRKNWMKKHGR